MSHMGLIDAMTWWHRKHHPEDDYRNEDGLPDNFSAFVVVVALLAAIALMLWGLSL